MFLSFPSYLKIEHQVLEKWKTERRNHRITVWVCLLGRVPICKMSMNWNSFKKKIRTPEKQLTWHSKLLPSIFLQVCESSRLNFIYWEKVTGRVFQTTAFLHFWFGAYKHLQSSALKSREWKADENATLDLYWECQIFST